MLNVLSALFPLANTQDNTDRYCSCNYGKSIPYIDTCLQDHHCERLIVRPTARE